MMPTWVSTYFLKDGTLMQLLVLQAPRIIQKPTSNSSCIREPYFKK